MGYQYAWHSIDSASPPSRLVAVATRLHCVVGNRPRVRPSRWGCGIIGPWSRTRETGTAGLLQPIISSERGIDEGPGAARGSPRSSRSHRPTGPDVFAPVNGSSGGTARGSHVGGDSLADQTASVRSSEVASA